MRTLIVYGCCCLVLGTASASKAQDASVRPDSTKTATTLQIKLANVIVDDQAKAEKFYTDVLGFVKKHDVPLGEFRWLTVVSSVEPDGAQLLLEPSANEAARTFQKAIYEQGIPAVSFSVGDAAATFERLKSQGVTFTTAPTDVGGAIIAVFDDTCGNLVQIMQVKP